MKVIRPTDGAGPASWKNQLRAQTRGSGPRRQPIPPSVSTEQAPVADTKQPEPNATTPQETPAAEAAVQPPQPPTQPEELPPVEISAELADSALKPAPANAEPKVNADLAATPLPAGLYRHQGVAIDVKDVITIRPLGKGERDLALKLPTPSGLFRTDIAGRTICTLVWIEGEGDDAALEAFQQAVSEENTLPAEKEVEANEPGVQAEGDAPTPV